ncbi:hypothetical protein [Secundilactobacillus mixtipabuli]|uniref:GyrI-like small molecule binding domain-containing protein n=1 Tax=Secundilactobacillus mixtipabuli TaxID=1435342 RepID=A0A1Z5I989_9LACO|nr:hypothetical protein [Secundilactobacillus mixtipabuli]GAW98165.1 hypothetical protein IWT30_00108 [Secundilactobacillus mixtipabuli]
MFNWETYETAEYQRSEEPTLVELTTRSYITAEGKATQHTADDNFILLAEAVEKVAALIADSQDIGIEVTGFKPYRPYPIQAVWTVGGTEEQFKIWLKQPLFIHQDIFETAKKYANWEKAISDQIHFEQLAEGTEIQATGHGEIGPHAKTLQALNAAIEEAGFQRAHLDTYRELYLDGLPFSEKSDTLFRLKLDPAVGDPKPKVTN